MKSIRFCPHCGSPSKGSPCLYYVDRPSDGGDPPCFDDFYDDNLVLAEIGHYHSQNRPLAFRSPSVLMNGPVVNDSRPRT